MKQKTLDAIKELVDEIGVVKTSKETSIEMLELIKMLNLPFKTFDDINFIPHPMSGVRSVTMFENGYGASVVSHPMSYGGQMGLYELAVLDKNGELTYDTPITDDVIGYLTPEQVTEKLIEIQDLKN